MFVVARRCSRRKPGQVAGPAQGLGPGAADYKANTPEGRAIIAESVGSSRRIWRPPSTGVRYYSLAENKQALAGDFAKKTFADVQPAAKKAGILDKDVSAADLIDARFVDAAAK